VKLGIIPLGRASLLLKSWDYANPFTGYLKTVGLCLLYLLIFEFFRRAFRVKKWFTTKIQILGEQALPFYPSYSVNLCYREAVN